MTIDYFKFNNDKVSVIFNGSHYYFINQFFGIVAIAERDYSKEIDNKAFFILFVGNSQASNSYNAGISERVKKYITKEERKNILKKVTYKEVEKDLNLCYLDIQAKER